ncbi:MAG: nitroreductase family protein [Candidatus Lokiarchaeota archaeon]|nr:nitroreductase family protein [Candidatus Lokiarchaeota archaeon]
MNVLEAIRNRRSIRKYLSKPVEREKLEAILEAGRWAPSASNKQPWHFVVVTKEEKRKALADAHPYGRFMAESPVVIVVLGDSERHPKYYLADPHNAVMNMLLAAYAHDLGTCWMGVRDTDIEPKFRDLLNIPKSLRVICCISIGYHEVERDSTRRQLDEIVRWESY